MMASGTWCGRHGGFFQGMALALVLAAASCGPTGDSGVTETAGDPGLGPALASCSLNSVEGNGLATNGLAGNGLCGNGLAAAGLDAATMKTSGFATWFNADVALADMVMRYVYKCAASAGTSITWKNPTTGVGYTWAGGLGLAPGWTGGAAASVAEQQVVTACLGALTNKYGVNVTIAVEGRTAAGAQLAVGPTELATFSVKEACFFGNLFTGEGVFLAFDQPNWDPSRSSVRGCGVDINGVSVDCSPIVITGDECRDICTADKTGTFWESCTWNKKTYKPLTTRLKPADVYTCGDGVCQFTERCGTGTTAASCRTDCGLCP